MAIQVIPVSTSDVLADTNATINTIVLRDNTAGIYGGIVQGSTIQTTGNYQGTVSTQTSNFTAGAATHYLCDTTSGSITVTFPSAAVGNAGYQYIFYKKAAANTLTFTGVTGTGSLSSINTKAVIFSDGSNWYSAV